MAYRCFVVMMIVGLFELSALSQEPHEKLKDLPVLTQIASIDFEDVAFPQGLRFSPDGSKLWTNKLDAWSIPKGEKVHSSPLGKQKKSRLIFDLAAKQPLMLIVDRNSQKTLFWDRSSKPRVRSLRQEGDVSAAQLIDDGKRFALVYAAPPSIYFGDVNQEGNDEILPLPFKANACAIAPSGNLLATRGGGDIQLWDVKEKKTRTVLKHKTKVFSFTFSNDERFIATGTSQDNVVRLFDTEKGELIAEMAGHGKGTIFLASAVYSLAFSQNRKWLASGGHDGRVIVWDMKTHKPILKTQIAGPPIVCSVVFSPDSKLVAASFENANAKRGIRVWSVPETESSNAGKTTPDR